MFLLQEYFQTHKHRFIFYSDMDSWPTTDRQGDRQTDRQTESTGKRAHRQTVNKQRQTADSRQQLTKRQTYEWRFRKRTWGITIFPVVQTHLHSSKASTIPDFFTLFNASLWVQSSHLLLFMDLTVRPSWIPALSALLPGVTWKRQD